jgi:uncharacterized surface anchored protein
MSLPDGYVLNVPQPLHVQARPGSTTQLSLTLLRKARVTGSVQLVDSAGRRIALGGAVIELRRDGEVHRRTTTEDGRIEFNDLRPGKWQLSVVQVQLPAHFVFDNPDFEVDASPGSERRVVLYARAKPRNIRLQEEKTLQPRS